MLQELKEEVECEADRDCMFRGKCMENKKCACSPGATGYRCGDFSVDC